MHLCHIAHVVQYPEYVRFCGTVLKIHVCCTQRKEKSFVINKEINKNQLLQEKHTVDVYQSRVLTYMKIVVTIYM